MSKTKFTDDFESNVRRAVRRKSLPSLAAAFEFATLETLNAILAKRSSEPVFRRIRMYGEHLAAMYFMEAARWNPVVAAAVPEAMLPHLKALAKFQRKHCRFTADTAPAP